MEARNYHKFCLDPANDGKVTGDLDRITKAILETGLEVTAIALYGSFGRGEGVFRDLAEGQALTTNDYDLAIITAAPVSFLQKQRLKKIRGELASELGLGHLDFLLTTSTALKNANITMERYDLKFGGQVLYGEADILDSIPYQASSRIPPGEIQNLLVNRLATLLFAHPNSTLIPDLAEKARQISKVLYAVVDSRLVANDAYATRYKQKETNLEIFSQSDSISAELGNEIEWMRAARKYQLELDAELLNSKWPIARKMLVSELFHISQIELSDAESLFRNWRDKCSNKPSRQLLHSIATLILGRPKRADTERRLFGLAYAYPEARTYQNIGFSVPSFPQSPQVWSELADQCLKDWTKS